MATVQLNENWRLRSDEYPWTLEKANWVREGSKTGQKLIAEGEEAVAGRVPQWKGVRYYSDLSRACERFVARQGMLSEAKTIAELRAVVQDAQANVNATVKQSGISF